MRTRRSWLATGLGLLTATHSLPAFATTTVAATKSTRPPAKA